MQGSRTLELFRAITVLVFPTDTSKAKAMAKTCKPGGERGRESEDTAPVRSPACCSPVLPGAVMQPSLLQGSAADVHPRGRWSREKKGASEGPLLCPYSPTSGWSISRSGDPLPGGTWKAVGLSHRSR